MSASRDQVNQRRLDGAIAGVGVIESGLSRKPYSTRSGLGLSTSRKNAQDIDKSLTTDSSNRIGNVSLKKCESKTSAVNKLFALGTSRTKVDVGSSNNSSNGKALLYPMKVNIPQGSITAILGTSESGKSTLLKFLAGCADDNLDCEGVGELRIPSLLPFPTIDGFSNS